jgi:CHAD domain-containing protein
VAYRLNLGSDDPAGDLRGRAREQLSDAVSGLRDRDADPVTATHEARKDVKKVRALLRLARGCLPADAYRAENARLREIARSLAGARDADVLVQTTEGLVERHAGKLPEAAFARLRARLAAAAERSRAGAGGRVGEPALAALDAAADATDDWPLEPCDVDALVRGAVRAYRRGRRALARAERERTTENLHEWRKRAKDLWYHARLLEEAWPRLLKAQAKEAHKLADLLGDDHDLAMLAAQLDSGGQAAGVALDEATLRQLISRDRADLQARAWLIGHRLYGERPKAYERRLTGYLRWVGSHASRDPA